MSWNAVAQASTYAVLDSTTSATSGYTVLSTGLTGTSFRTASLATGNYWFEVSATVGANWTGSPSSATGETTVTKNTSCTQP